MAVRKAVTISVKDLSAAVSKAVAQEGDSKIFGPDFTIDHNIIMGRILRELVALEQAEAAAARITQVVGQSRFQTAAGEEGALPVLASHFEPAVLASHGRIICGFIIDRQVILRE